MAQLHLSINSGARSPHMRAGIFPHASLAFADLHAAFAEAATGDDEFVQRRIGRLHHLAQNGRLPSGNVAPALCAGAAALARGATAEAARLLEAALADLPRIGGSHAQREVFEDSLILAYLRSGQPAKAEPLLRLRLSRRPSARDEAWLAQANERQPASITARNTRGKYVDSANAGRAGSAQRQVQACAERWPPTLTACYVDIRSNYWINKGGNHGAIATLVGPRPSPQYRAGADRP
jgi:hypothetical protein